MVVHKCCTFRLKRKNLLSPTPDACCALLALRSIQVMTGELQLLGESGACDFDHGELTLGHDSAFTLPWTGSSKRGHPELTDLDFFSWVVIKIISSWVKGFVTDNVELKCMISNLIYFNLWSCRSQHTQHVFLFSCFFYVNTLRPRQYGRHFADDTFKRIFVNENVRISIKISLRFVPKGS